MRECGARKVLDIGDQEGQTSASKLGFSEVYFQYFIEIESRKFIAFQLE